MSPRFCGLLTKEMGLEPPQPPVELAVEPLHVALENHGLELVLPATPAEAHAGCDELIEGHAAVAVDVDDRPEELEGHGAVHLEGLENPPELAILWEVS